MRTWLALLCILSLFAAATYDTDWAGISGTVALAFALWLLVLVLPQIAHLMWDSIERYRTSQPVAFPKPNDRAQKERDDAHWHQTDAANESSSGRV